MKPPPRPYALSPRRAAMLDAAIAEQARRVDHLTARLSGEQDRAERKRLTTLRGDVDWIWSDIIVWLRDDIAPDPLARCRDAIARAAQSATTQLAKSAATDTEHPHAAHWRSVILLDHAMRQRFPIAAERIAA